MEHEAALIRAFVLPRRRARYLQFLNYPVRREKSLRVLDHLRNLDARYVQRIPPDKQSATDIETLLRRKGAPTTCHVISASRNIDGREMPLLTVLAEVVGCGMATLLSCIPGRLGYFESEDVGERYLLERPRACQP